MNQIKIRERTFIPSDYLAICMKIADKDTGGIIFPHTYINSSGQRCRHISPLNTEVYVPKIEDLNLCRDCGIQEQIGSMGRVYCDCIRYPPIDKDGRYKK